MSARRVRSVALALWRAPFAMAASGLAGEPCAALSPSCPSPTWRLPLRLAGCVACCLLNGVGAATIWEVGDPQGHIETREDLPTPHEFFVKYVRGAGGPFHGVGKPVLFKGAAKKMPAFHLWTDEYLRKQHGDAIFDQVETEKKETRMALPKEDMKLSQFLDAYTSSSLYSVAKTPAGLADEVFLLPFMNCGGFHKRLAETVTWISSGSTQSVIHSDSNQNVHCMFAGKKRWALWSPRTPLDEKEHGWVQAEEEAAAFQNAYGAFAGRIDVDAVDLDRFPGWTTFKWWNMTLDAGDCAFIPQAWFHYVEAPPLRSISVHVWFRAPKQFDQATCDKFDEHGMDPSEYLVRIGDCTWGWEPGGSGPNAKGTRCRIRKSAKRPEDEL